MGLLPAQASQAGGSLARSLQLPAGTDGPPSGLTMCIHATGKRYVAFCTFQQMQAAGRQCHAHTHTCHVRAMCTRWKPISYPISHIAMSCKCGTTLRPVHMISDTHKARIVQHSQVRGGGQDGKKSGVGVGRSRLRCARCVLYNKSINPSVPADGNGGRYMQHL